MTDPSTQKIARFLEENRPLECSFCAATVAFQNKNTGGLVGICFSGCTCWTQFVAPLAQPDLDLGKEAAPKKGEDYVDRGNSEEDFPITARKQQELQESMKERKNAREQEALKKEREEEASKKRIDQEEEALERQRKDEEAQKKQKMEEEASRKLKDEEPQKKLKEEKAKKREEFQQKLIAENEHLDKAKEESMQKAETEMNLSRKTLPGMTYSRALLKSGAIVHIVFSWSPIDFHIVCDEDNDQLVLLQKDLFERVTSGKLKKTSGKLERDDVVVAEYDGAYYRARVSNSNSVKCQLSFIDYGDRAIKNYEEIYEIPDDLFMAPIYGLKVRLYGLDPMDFTVRALVCDTVETSVYETTYSLELMDGKGFHTYGILLDINSGETLNDVVKKSLTNK